MFTLEDIKFHRCCKSGSTDAHNRRRRSPHAVRGVPPAALPHRRRCASLEFSPEPCRNGECECRELLIRGKRVPSPIGYDCEYVKARSALIREPERIATKEVATRSPSEDGGVSYAAWTRAFSAAMDELARPLLVI
jgi:hypothetical protein